MKHKNKTLDGYERIETRSRVFHFLSVILGIIVLIIWASVALLVACLNQSGAYHD